VSSPEQLAGVDGPGRSYLFAPGDRPDVVNKAIAAGADAVVIDLEDAVSEEHKDEARANTALRLSVGRHATPLHVRVSSCAAAVSDLEAVAGAGLAGVRVPKVEDPDALRVVADWITSAAAAGRIAAGVGIYPTFESAAGVAAASAILAAVPWARTRPVLGSADLLADLGIWDGDGFELLAHVQADLAVRARAAGVGSPIDGAYPRIDDEDGLARAARQARSLGFAGKSAIHPRQLAVVHSVFSATPQQYERAQRIVEAYDASLAAGSAAVAWDGQMLDAAVVARARSLLATRPSERPS
jgi:citrate lyase subunit beta/citryl-CoA lyase